MEFKIGDIVQWCGAKGYIKSEDGEGFLLVMFPTENESERNAYFDKTGRYRYWHPEPSLKLIERPKQKVKKYKILFIDIYDEWKLSSSYYETVEKFDMHNIYKVKMLLEQTMVEDDE